MMTMDALLSIYFYCLYGIWKHPQSFGSQLERVLLVQVFNGEQRKFMNKQTGDEIMEMIQIFFYFLLWSPVPNNLQVSCTKTSVAIFVRIPIPNVSFQYLFLILIEILALFFNNRQLGAHTRSLYGGWLQILIPCSNFAFESFPSQNSRWRK